jgi:ABC-type transport system substrate-binding protein
MLSVKCQPPGWEDWPQGYQKFGPRTEHLLFDVYNSVYEMEADYRRGFLDLTSFPFQVEGDPDFVTDLAVESGMVQISSNNEKWPTCNQAFRKALSYAADKAGWVAVILGTQGMPIDTPVHPALTNYVNPSVPTYRYNLATASTILDDAGFLDHEGDGYREFWNSTTNMWEDVRLDVTRLAGSWGNKISAMIDTFVSTLSTKISDGGLGIQVNVAVGWGNPFRAGSVSSVVPQSVIDGNYNIFATKLLFERTPDYLYSLYDSRFIPTVYNGRIGCNWIRFNNSTYNECARKLVSDCATIEEAIDASFECQRILMEQAAIIPVWVETPETSYSSRWTHAVNLGAYDYPTSCGPGFNNYWTYLNMHPKNEERSNNIDYGTMGEFRWLNPVTTCNVHDWEILDEIYEPLIKPKPYNITDDIEWMAQREIGTYFNSEIGKTCSKITFHVRPNILWHDNILLTGGDVAFTIDYIRNVAGDNIAYDYFKVHLVDHVEWDPDEDSNRVAVYFSVETPLAAQWIGDLPIIPKHIWSLVSNPLAYDPPVERTLIGSGPFEYSYDYSDLTEQVHLTANPTYFRELVRPDFVNSDIQPFPDGEVDIDDFGMVIAKCGDAKPWTDPTWGPLADVNKDYCVELDDIMETGVRYALTGCIEGYPPGYVDDPPGLGAQSSTITFNKANTGQRLPSAANQQIWSGQTSAGSFGPTVSVYPEMAAAKLGETFAVSIVVSNVTDLFGWQFMLNFNSSAITFVNIAEGSFLANAGDTIFATKINSTSGFIMASSTLWPYPSQGATGDGILATMTFYVQAHGATSLDFSGTKLRTVIGDSIAPIDHSSTNGDFLPIERIPLSTVGCSSQTEPYTAEKTADGNYTSYWQSEKRKTTDQWIKYALPTNYNLTSLKILPYGSGYGVKNFKLLVSADGVTYTEAYSNTAQDSSTLQTFELPGFVSKYAQLYCVDNYGAPFYLRINEFELHGHISQNDANSGSDGGDTFRLATSISPNDYIGYADGSFDPDDWYKFNATVGKFINITMTPPTGWNYDLFLHDPFGDQKAISNTTGDATEHILYKANSTGEWRLHISVCTASSKGEYSFTLEVKNAMHVESISFWRGWKGQTETLFIQVTILDQNGTPVSDATVSGTLVPVVGGNEFYSDPTESDGTVTFEYSVKNSELPTGTYRFTVTNVQKTDWIYDYAANKETSDTYTKGSPH